VGGLSAIGPAGSAPCNGGQRASYVLVPSATHLPGVGAAQHHIVRARAWLYDVTVAAGALPKCSTNRLRFADKETPAIRGRFRDKGCGVKVDRVPKDQSRESIATEEVR
jgi:hypothetical protein